MFLFYSIKIKIYNIKKGITNNFLADYLYPDYFYKQISTKSCNSGEYPSGNFGAGLFITISFKSQNFIG